MKVGEMHQQNRQAWNEGAARYEENEVPPSVDILIDAGLRLERFEEHPDQFFETFPNLPDEIARRNSQTFSLLMRKE